MSETENESKEKRDFTRLRIDAPTELVITGDEPQAIKGICRDLSAGGMLVETRVELRRGTEVEVVLATHRGDGAMLKARARIARVQNKDAGRFTLGLEIVEILD